MVARNKVSLRPFLLNIQNLCFDTRNAENSFFKREREGWGLGILFNDLLLLFRTFDKSK